MKLETDLFEDNFQHYSSQPVVVGTRGLKGS